MPRNLYPSCRLDWEFGCILYVLWDLNLSKDAFDCDVMNWGLHCWTFYIAFLCGVSSCLLRIVDSFGTEAMFNHATYAKLHRRSTTWGKQNLNLRQFFTMFRKLYEAEVKIMFVFFGSVENIPSAYECIRTHFLWDVSNVVWIMLLTGFFSIRNLIGSIDGWCYGRKITTIVDEFDCSR